ncbi:MAG: helix-turn-helix transcriptional regulator, partial [Clostridia bacterium]|nr:helix-turn-helix transcriptional regulator [Clostridia bacterium]
HCGTHPTSNVSFFWLHFTCVGADIPLPTASRPENQDRVMLLARELLHYSETEGYPDECTDSMMRVLLFELLHESGEVGRLVYEIKERVRRAKGKPIRISALARELGYNEDYLCRVFKKSAKVPLKQYITDARAEMIKRDLLVGGESLTELSDKYGFTEYKYFLKFFKYHTGISPSSYRKTYYNLHTN